MQQGSWTGHPDKGLGFESEQRGPESSTTGGVSVRNPTDLGHVDPVYLSMGA